LFENFSVNSLKRDLANNITVNPPLFSFVNTFKESFLIDIAHREVKSVLQKLQRNSVIFSVITSSSSFILPQATRHHRLARAQNIFKKFSFLRYKKLQKHIDGTGE
jgi:hypothetical protein